MVHIGLAETGSVAQALRRFRHRGFIGHLLELDRTVVIVAADAVEVAESSIAKRVGEVHFVAMVSEHSLGESVYRLGLFVVHVVYPSRETSKRNFFAVRNRV